MSDERTTAGDVEIENVVIINNLRAGVNLRDVTTRISIHEDIASAFITGSLTISDSNALSEMLPLVGEEILVLDIATPDFTNSGAPLLRRHLECFIYKMESADSSSIKNRSVVLNFVSKEAFTDVNLRLSQTYRGKISDTVRQMLSGSLKTSKKIIIDETSNTNIHTSNYWTPSQNIYYLTSRALGGTNQPNYVFFENNEGFVFSSLDKLYSMPPVNSFVRHEKERRVDETRDIYEDYSTVTDFQVSTFYDYYERVQSGFFGSSIYQYDIQTKRLNFRNFLARDDIKTTRLNEFLPYGGGLQFHPEASLATNIIHQEVYNSSPILTIDHHVRRMAHLSQLNSYKLNIQVFGRMDYTVGRVIDLLVYSNDPTTEVDDDKSLIDEMLSGRYIITAINHEIHREKHVCNMEICKDSLIKDLSVYKYDKK